MSFKKEQLQAGEIVAIDTHPHFVTLVGPLSLFLISFFFAVALAAEVSPWFLLLAIPFGIWFIYRWLIRSSSEYIVTNRRIVKQQGLLTKTSVDSPLDKINNIFHEQSVFQRLIDNGKVSLETASELGMVNFPNVPHPLSFKNTIEAQRERSRTGAGAPTKISAVETLERLSKLKDGGFITDEEFQSQKKRLFEQT
ncbi:MAG TPA: PH domain-containing protein [Acidobacteriota bacterium]|jgi:uncharacterized membrane protein YdbT with pleckstrin-like domain|nr:PH domain-containing protein [Acidobacteriota bacterium]